MSRDELLELARAELTVDIETAGRAYGIGRAKAYQLAMEGTFPIQVLKIVGRYRVRTAALVADLLLQSEDEPSSKDSPSSTSTLGQENGSHDHANPLHAA